MNTASRSRMAFLGSAAVFAFLYFMVNYKVPWKSGLDEMQNGQTLEMAFSGMVQMDRAQQLAIQDTLSWYLTTYGPEEGHGFMTWEIHTEGVGDPAFRLHAMMQWDNPEAAAAFVERLHALSLTELSSDAWGESRGTADLRLAHPYRPGEFVEAAGLQYRLRLS